MIASESSLQSLPGVGPSLAADLEDLGYDRAGDLIGQDPETMYERLCAMRGARLDPCVLYVFRCAVYAAGAERPDPEKLKWWNWKRTG